jgi:hypothetical protein
VRKQLRFEPVTTMDEVLAVVFREAGRAVHSTTVSGAAAAAVPLAH